MECSASLDVVGGEGSSRTDTSSHEQEEVSPQYPNLKKQLAVAVRSIRWSYGIFWSGPSSDPGILEWYDGYFNGEIKTRKTVQSTESNDDPLGLQRSDQLRELYETLLLGEDNQPENRPTAALTPEDLSNDEWYFLTCMSFSFEVGEGLPGRVMAKNKAIWLVCSLADRKVFPRLLLARTSGIQTVVCFPYLGGVVELGTTELVEEDPNLIKNVMVNFLSNPSATVPVNLDNDMGNIKNDNSLAQEDSTPENGLDNRLEPQNMDVHSSNNSSDDLVENFWREDSDLVEGETCYCEYMDDNAIGILHNLSMNSSDSVSQTYEDQGTIVTQMEARAMQGTREWNQREVDIHYQRVISCFRVNSNQLILGHSFRNKSRKSSFVSWVKHGSQPLKTKLADISTKASMGVQAHRDVLKQKLLKKMLIDVPRLHENCRSEGKEISSTISKAEENDKSHVLSERKRREKINGRFMILGSLITSDSKVNRVSLLDHTIKYIQELERKVEVLEAHKEATELESSTQLSRQDTAERTSTQLSRQDTAERTSDNCGSSKRKLSTSKKKLDENDKAGVIKKKARLRDLGHVMVQVSDKDIFIESRCSWTDNMVAEIIGSINKLHLDIQTFEISNTDGILSVTSKAKCKESKAPSASEVKLAIKKVISDESKRLG